MREEKELKRFGRKPFRPSKPNKRNDDLRDWLKRDSRSNKSLRNERQEKGRNSKRTNSPKFNPSSRFSPPPERAFHRERSPGRILERNSTRRKRSLSRSRERLNINSRTKYSPYRNNSFDRESRRTRKSRSYEFENRDKFSPRFQPNESHHHEQYKSFDTPRKEENFPKYESFPNDQNHQNYQKDVRFTSNHREEFYQERSELDRREEDAIPEFNPESSKISAKHWMKILDNIAVKNKWEEDHKRFNMVSKLAGFARQWYLTVGKNIYKYKDLRFKFIQSFPSEMDYCEHLTKMLERKKKEDESFACYFDHKVALLNVCDITGSKAVSCIIGGLTEEKLRKEAKEKDFTNANELLDFLRSKEIEKSTSENFAKEKLDNIVCYHCKKMGHKKVYCPLLSNKMSHHENQNKFKYEDEVTSRSSNMVMYGALSDIPAYPEYFKEVKIDGVPVTGYVDYGSENVTIKEETAISLGLKYQKVYKLIKSFGGNLISCVGEFEGFFKVDKDVAKAVAYIIPDHIQAIPVVLGKSFTKQQHFSISPGIDFDHLNQRGRKHPREEQSRFYEDKLFQSTSLYY